MSNIGVFAGAGMAMGRRPLLNGELGGEPGGELAWRQVAERDGAARFLYGVTSTGIFCRPSCPSRRPAQHNVVYFRHAGEATAAGFRACLRCQPAGAPAEADTVAAVCEYLKANRDRRVTLAELAKVAGRSPFTVQRVVQRVLGISPLEYQRELRAAALRDGLASAATRVTDAIYDAGYSSLSRAYEDSPLGMTPAKYRARAAGESIRFAIADCPLGMVLVARTERGICSIMLGDSAAELEGSLRLRFAGAEVSLDGRDEAGPGLALSQAMSQIISQMTEHPSAVELPMDVRATAFQTRVWQALRQIPRGETRSYAAVARSVGNSKAVRAVARACASNPVALLVPCHRVIASDGKLIGYRWGVERKRRLLQMEQNQTPPGVG